MSEQPTIADYIGCNEVKTSVYSTRIDPRKTATVAVDHVRIGDRIFNPVRMGAVFDGLAATVLNHFRCTALPREAPAVYAGKPDGPITAVNMYS